MSLIRINVLLKDLKALQSDMKELGTDMADLFPHVSCGKQLHTAAGIIGQWINGIENGEVK